MLVIQPRAPTFLYQPKFVCYFFFPPWKGKQNQNTREAQIFKVPDVHKYQGPQTQMSLGHRQIDSTAVYKATSQKEKLRIGWSSPKLGSEAEAGRVYLRAAANWCSLCQEVGMRTQRVITSLDRGQVRPHSKELQYGSPVSESLVASEPAEATQPQCLHSRENTL